MTFTSRPQQPTSQVPEASSNRLAVAAMLDGALALLGGLAACQRAFPDTDGVIEFVGGLILCLLGISFVNHVVGTLLFRGSVGKYLSGLRVLRWKNGGRPRFWQTLWRWLFGYVLIAFQYLLEGESVGQACGLRTVRRRDEAAGITVGPR